MQPLTLRNCGSLSLSLSLSLSALFACEATSPCNKDEVLGVEQANLVQQCYTTDGAGPGLAAPSHCHSTVGAGAAEPATTAPSGAVWSRLTPEGPPPVRTPVAAVLGMPPRVFVRVHPKPRCTAPPRCRGWGEPQVAKVQCNPRTREIPLQGSIGRSGVRHPPTVSEPKLTTRRIGCRTT